MDNKPIRKAVRIILEKEGKIIVIQYKKGDIGFYDLPGGKIEDNETSIDAAIREFKEETGMDIIKPIFLGNVKIEYPNRIFDFDIYQANDYNGEPLDLDENKSMWIDIDTVLQEEKKYPSIDLFKDIKNIPSKLIVDENHNITGRFE